MIMHDLMKLHVAADGYLFDFFFLFLLFFCCLKDQSIFYSLLFCSVATSSRCLSQFFALRCARLLVFSRCLTQTQSVSNLILYLCFLLSWTREPCAGDSFRTRHTAVSVLTVEVYMPLICCFFFPPVCQKLLIFSFYMRDGDGIRCTTRGGGWGRWLYIFMFLYHRIHLDYINFTFKTCIFW